MRCDSVLKLFQGSIQHCWQTQIVSVVVEIVKELSTFLEEQQVTPVLWGSAADPGYASNVKSHLKDAFPSGTLYL